MQKGKLVSVIVPVYKVEKYLSFCVDSIINQTYRNLEIILVDDGSPDRCGAMCDAYAAEDSRVRVIHKENGGLSDARNAGLDVFSGDYVCFVDSDDAISLNFVDHMLELVDEETELAVCVPKRFVQEDELGREPAGATRKFSTDEAMFEQLRQHELRFEPSAWAKLYSARIFSELRFPVGKYYEDLAISYRVVDMVSSVGHTTEELYYYRLRADSQSESSFNIKFMDILDISDEMREFLLPKYPELEEVINARVISAYSHILIRLPEAKCWDDTKVRIYQRIVALRKGLIKAPIRKKTKGIVLLSYLGKAKFLWVVAFIVKHKGK